MLSPAAQSSRLSGRLGNGERSNFNCSSPLKGRHPPPSPPRFPDFLISRFLAVSPLKEPLWRRELKLKLPVAYQFCLLVIDHEKRTPQVSPSLQSSSLQLPRTLRNSRIPKVSSSEFYKQMPYKYTLKIFFSFV